MNEDDCPGCRLGLIYTHLEQCPKHDSENCYICARTGKSAPALGEKEFDDTGTWACGFGVGVIMGAVGAAIAIFYGPLVTNVFRWVHG